MIVIDLETVPGIPLEVAAQMSGDDDPASYASLSPPLAKIVCVGLFNSKGKRAISGSAENEIVEEAFSVISDTRMWPVVTFNGRRFDLPVLMAAAMRHGITIPRKVLGLMTEYRYSKEPNHIDLWDVLTNFGAGKGGLRAWCIGLGLGDPKSEGDGAKVAELYAAGKIAQIEKYCLSDCEFTARLYQRWIECTKG